MDKAHALDLLQQIAIRDVNQTEVTRNRAPWIAKFWPATSYPDGMKNREPYCAAACCYWLAQWGRELAAKGELRNTLGMSLAEFEKWRCKDPRAFGWIDWAKRRNLQILPETAPVQMGDFMVFDMSHIGLARYQMGRGGNLIRTIEANTGNTTGNDGEGCFFKDRPRPVARCFIRILA